MSAFVCSTKTLAAVASNLTATFNVGAESAISADDFAEEMLLLNLRSVGYRYDLTLEKTCKEFVGKSVKEYTRIVREVAKGKEAAEVTPERLLGAADCFLYQSCERDDYEEDPVYRTVDRYAQMLRALCDQKGSVSEGWDL